MVFKPKVLLGFHPNPKIIKGKVGKALNGTRRMWNPPFVSKRGFPTSNVFFNFAIQTREWQTLCAPPTPRVVPIV